MGDNVALIPCRKCGAPFDPRPNVWRMHPTDTCDNCVPDPYTPEQLEKIAEAFADAPRRR